MIISDLPTIARGDLSEAVLSDMVHIAEAMSDGERIRAARKEAGLSQAELGLAMGLPQSVISDWENGKLQSWRESPDKLATVLKKPRGYFTPPSPPVHTRGIEVVGSVRGGAFQLAVEWPVEDRYEVPVAPLPGYEGLKLRALRVDGPSMNELYPDGSYVIVVDTADTDVRPGDRVVVYSFQGELREATIKEVRVEKDGRIGLYPRSTHPDFQTPMFIDPRDSDSQDAPEIAYVVVGSFNQEQRPPAPIQFRRKRR